MKKLAGEIALAPSAAYAEKLLCCGMMQRRDMTVRGGDGLALPDEFKQFASVVGYDLDDSGDGIALSKKTAPDAITRPVCTADKDDFFRKMLIMARAGCDAPLALPDRVEEDFELELILYRRMGFDCELVDACGQKLCRPSLAPAPAMKYRLPEKNYHLIDPLISGVMASGCAVELVSSFDIDLSAWTTFPNLGIETGRVDGNAEEDELSRRINRRRHSAAEEFRFLLRRSEMSEDRIEAYLPGDRLAGLFAAGAACLTRNSRIKLSNVPRTRGVSSAFRMLGKMGAEVSISNTACESAPPVCDVAIASGKLVGRRFGGDSIRACPEVSCVLASLGMPAEGKTVIRDLPFGSNSWRKRVGIIREILHSCGARVGEIEDGLVVEGGGELMMMDYRSTGDEMCELTQQMLSFALPHHAGYREPPHFAGSALFNLCRGLIA